MNNTSDTSVCANCGQGEEAGNNLKTCTACKLVKYCSRDCQVAHRPQHKKECKKRAKELHEIELFKQPPPLEDCPICMIRLPTFEPGRAYMACCGKVICTGCIYAVQSRAVKEEEDICPFCRTPAARSQQEIIQRYKKRVELNDAMAMFNMGNYYSEGQYRLPRNYAKAVELWRRAGELGNAQAYQNLSSAYRNGHGVGIDGKKSVLYRDLAAMKGSVLARFNLGGMEYEARNMDRALKHWMIAVKDGEPSCLEYIRNIYSNGCATKDEYTQALRSYQTYLEGIKSDQRDEAAANWGSKYYESSERQPGCNSVML